MKEIPLTLHQYLNAGPKPPTHSEFSAVDSLHAAFLALSESKSHDDEPSSLARDAPCDNPDIPSPMGYTSLAVRSALTLLCERVGMNAADAGQIWADMIDNGCSAEHNYTLQHASKITRH